MGGRESKLVLMDDNGIRCDGRKVDETRRISIKAGVLRNANGSAYIEFGITPVSSQTSLRCSSRPRPSIRLSCSNNAAICLRFN